MGVLCDETATIAVLQRGEVCPRRPMRYARGPDSTSCYALKAIFDYESEIRKFVDIELSPVQ